jgi:hypothetical protein
MGNGPSLLQSLEAYKDKLSTCDLIVVNDMGLSPEYEKYKPDVYVLCDPAYWLDNISSEETDRILYLYEQLVRKTDWPLQLYLPYIAKKEEKIQQILSRNTHIRLHYYNNTKVEGFKWFQYMILKRQWGMFRAQNVIVAALLLAIYFDYKQIYLMGADSDWMKNLWVDEQNCLRLRDTHFYEGKIQDRIIPVSMSHQCAALYYLFRSYKEINRYASSKKIKIYNTYKYSFIDVFDKI